MKLFDFMKRLKAKPHISVGELSTLKSSIASGVPSLDKSIKAAPVVAGKYGVTLIGNVPVGRFTRYLREGNLGELMKINSNKIPITGVDAKTYASIVKDTPEAALKSVRDAAEGSARKYPHLDTGKVTGPNVSKTTTKAVEKIESNLRKRFPSGTKIALGLGVVVVGAGWLSKVLDENKGCFMVTTIGGKTTSCKVDQLSCVGKGGTMCPNPASTYNTTLSAIQIAKRADTDALKKRLATAMGVAADKLHDELPKLIDTQFPKLVTTIEAEFTAKAFTPGDFCTLVHPGIENGVVPPCRMCNTAAHPVSTEYRSSEAIPDNVTYHCETNPTVLGVVADLAKNAAVNVLDGVSQGLMALVKPLLSVLLAIGGVIAAIAVVLFFIRRSNSGGGAANRPPSDQDPLLDDRYAFAPPPYSYPYSYPVPPPPHHTQVA